MNIVVLGNINKAKELFEKTADSLPIKQAQYNDLDAIGAADVIIDLDLHEKTDNVSLYSNFKQKVIIANMVKIQAESLFAALGKPGENTFFSANLLPTFINRTVLEMANPLNQDEKIAEDIAIQLGYTKVKWVKSRVGLVTPRLVFMIINEAYYTLQEGTATADDIDLGMKLGTNYPLGPFEWCKKVGIKDVYEILEALYMDTHDERYKVCPLLKTEYLKNFIK